MARIKNLSNNQKRAYLREDVRQNVVLIKRSSGTFRTGWAKASGTPGTFLFKSPGSVGRPRILRRIDYELRQIA